MEWRLLETGQQSGAMNMAIDEALLIAHAEEPILPTLRFYAWAPPAVSLGYSQPAHDVNVDACRRLGYDLVRRPTGGRAILHDHEVTYSVVIREDLVPGDSSVLASYRWISSGLLEGLKLLGVEAHLGPSGARRGGDLRTSKAACFAYAARGDAVHEGRKVMGSSQVRRRRCILQHGSIPLSLNRQVLAQLFAEPGDLSLAIALSETYAGQAAKLKDIVACLKIGFTTALSATLSQGELCEQEITYSQYLQESKYNQQAWTLHRLFSPTGIVE